MIIQQYLQYQIQDTPVVNNMGRGCLRNTTKQTKCSNVIGNVYRCANNSIRIVIIVYILYSTYRTGTCCHAIIHIIIVVNMIMTSVFDDCTNYNDLDLYFDTVFDTPSFDIDSSL